MGEKGEIHKYTLYVCHTKVVLNFIFSYFHIFIFLYIHIFIFHKFVAIIIISFIFVSRNLVFMVEKMETMGKYMVNYAILQ